MRLTSWKMEQQSKKYPILEQILLQKSFMRLAPGPEAHCARQLEGGIRRLWVLLRLETKSISLKNLASFLTPKSCQMFFFDAILNE